MSNYLKERIELNRKNLEVLDHKIEELEKLKFVSSLPVPERDGCHPFFYQAYGERYLDVTSGETMESAPGIHVPFVDSQPPQSGIVPRRVFEGTIQIDADAPFIWTHVGATYRREFVTSIRDQGGHLIPHNTYGEKFQSVSNPVLINQETIPAFTNDPPIFNIGLLDSASGRYFFQAEEQDVNIGGSETRGELPPGALLDFNKNLGVFANIEGAPGHGPCNLVELPAQTELPISGTMRVQVQPTQFNRNWTLTADVHPSYRVFVVLLGYKILVD